MNVQHRTSNEGILSVLKKDFAKRFHPSSLVLRHSIFCGSLFNPGHRNGQSNHHETVPFWGSFIQWVKSGIPDFGQYFMQFQTVVTFEL
jgi:hypothetical protein